MIACDVGWTKYFAPAGNARLPAVWSPWSDPITTCVIGRGVISAISATSRCVSATLPWPSATSTPAGVTTNRLTVVNFSCRPIAAARTIHAVGEPLDAWEIRVGVAALVRIAGADERRGLPDREDEANDRD